MDKYPAGSLDYNVPLLVVSGLGSGSTKPLLTDPDLKRHGILIRSELPTIDTREAKLILQYLQGADGTHLPWNANDTSRKHRFKIKTIGREFLLPPRKARLPEDFEESSSAPVLHSPFSPLSFGSATYPDGLIDTEWLKKHQELIPSICLAFYNLTSDSTLATLNDNQLKTDINAVKNAISQSGYKCRLAVVLLCDQAPTTMSGYQERLENIRKSTGLDPKASLFVLPTQRSEPEIETAVDNVLGAVFAQAAEYYRDLGRHARKKKGRGTAPQPTVPPTTGTSHTLTLQGWNVRYDFKSGVFAEFREETDAALRLYEQAYDALVGADVMESIPSWAPRFNDARLLADMIAIRAIRCLMWMGQSTAAVRRWQAHRNKTSDLVERIGRGTQNYGWHAWEATWAEVMANMVEKVDYPELAVSAAAIFRQPEKTLSAERLQPWELLHHQGYWYWKAVQHSVDRRTLALAILEDDRVKPQESSSTTRAAAYTSYDSYLCLSPNEEYALNHSEIIVGYLNRARTEFQKRKQSRLSASLLLDYAKELETMESWKQLLELLTPMWRDMTFRKEGWWDINESISWTLRDAAVKAGNADLVVAVDWELLNQHFTKRPSWHYDMAKSLEGVQAEPTSKVKLSDENITSFISSSFAFKHDEGRAGQSVPAQLSITSHAFEGSPPIALSEIRIDFEGSLRPIILKPWPSSESSSLGPHKQKLIDVQLKEVDTIGDEAADEEARATLHTSPSVVLQGQCDLVIPPGRTQVFHMNLPLREAGEAKASTIQVSFAPESFVLTYTMHIKDMNLAGFWQTPLFKRVVTRLNPHNIKVLPRPPKMEVKFVNVSRQYYAGEPIRVEVEILNEEDVDAITKLDTHLYGQDVPDFTVQTLEGPGQASVKSGEEGIANDVAAGTIASSKSVKATILVQPVDRPTAYDLTVKAWYNLVSDPGTPIVQIVAFQINVVNPFEASYDLVPRLHTDAWPSVFDSNTIQDTGEEDKPVVHAQGLAQKWCLATRFGSFATEDLTVLDLDLRVVATHGGVNCTASKNRTLPREGVHMSPKTMEEATFDLVAQKLSLDDRSPSTADLSFSITWKRSTDAGSSTPPNTTVFHLDPFYVTVAEPRVIATVSYSPSLSPEVPPPTPSPSSASEEMDLIFLDITIENPSSHFLTFGVSMEPSDEFAFSGSKSLTLNVLPAARRTVTYRLIPLVTSTWVKPVLVVRDKYFQKVLKVIPTQGMKRDGEGVAIWVPGPVNSGGEDGTEKQEDAS